MQPRSWKRIIKIQSGKPIYGVRSTLLNSKIGVCELKIKIKPFRLWPSTARLFHSPPSFVEGFRALPWTQSVWASPGDSSPLRTFSGGGSKRATAPSPPGLDACMQAVNRFRRGTCREHG